MAIPAYPAFESPFAASSTYWTGVSATGPMDMASLRAAIRAIIRIGPSATAARSDMLNMYPNNTQAISMNDRWVRAMIGPYVAATTTQTYGQGTSINFNAINSNASGLYTGQNIINVVNLFIKGFAMYSDTLDNYYSDFSKHFPIIECFYYGRGGYATGTNPFSTTMFVGSGGLAEHAYLSTSSDGWSFIPNSAAGTVWRTVRCPWATEVLASGTWTMQARGQAGYSGVGNATYCYVMGGYDINFSAIIATTSRFTYATLVNAAGPALTQTAGDATSVGNATYAYSCGGVTGVNYDYSSTTRRITYSTNTCVAGAALSGVKVFWQTQSASNSTVGNMNGYSAPGTPSGVIDIMTFATNVRSLGTALTLATGSSYRSSGGWSLYCYYDRNTSAFVNSKVRYNHSNNVVSACSFLSVSALDLVRTPNSVDGRPANQIDYIYDNHSYYHQCNSPAF